MATVNKDLDFLIIGVGKSGTTTLAEHLANHPQIALTNPKEPWFFDSNDYAHGMPWYWQRYLGHYAGEKCVGEASSQTLFVPFTPQRLAQLTPNAKLIAIFRDPVERAYSDWWMKYCTGLERESFEAAIAINFKQIEQGTDFSDPEIWQSHLDAHQRELHYKTYLQYGHYATQIERFLAFFPQEQMLFLTMQQLSRNRANTLDLVWRFLDVEPQLTHETDVPLVRNPSRSPAVAKIRRAIKHTPLARSGADTVSQIGRSILPRTVKNRLKSVLRRIDQGEKPAMPAATRAQLEGYYREEMNRFSVLTGLDI